MWWFGMDIVITFYTILAILVFSVYIIAHTMMIISEGTEITLSLDEYILGALGLYFSIILLFLLILVLLANGSRD
jgi:FtsH-binding integral membrane protein